MKILNLAVALTISTTCLAADRSDFIAADERRLERALIEGIPENATLSFRSKYYLKMGYSCAPDADKILREQSKNSLLMWENADLIKMCSFVAMRWMLVAKGRIALSDITNYDTLDYMRESENIATNHKDKLVPVGLVE